MRLARRPSGGLVRRTESAGAANISLRRGGGPWRQSLAWAHAAVRGGGRWRTRPCRIGSRPTHTRPEHPGCAGCPSSLYGPDVAGHPSSVRLARGRGWTRTPATWQTGPRSVSRSRRSWHSTCLRLRRVLSVSSTASRRSFQVTCGRKDFTVGNAEAAEAFSHGCETSAEGRACLIRPLPRTGCRPRRWLHTRTFSPRPPRAPPRRAR